MKWPQSKAFASVSLNPLKYNWSESGDEAGTMIRQLKPRYDEKREPMATTTT